MYTKLKKANHISEVSRALNRSPLQLEELDEFYRETSNARGQKTRTRIARELLNNNDINQHFLFVGYRGCGKSTELRRLEKDIQDKF